jgi:hypothetical protein
VVVVVLDPGRVGLDTTAETLLLTVPAVGEPGVADAEAICRQAGDAAGRLTLVTAAKYGTTSTWL